MDPDKLKLLYPSLSLNMGSLVLSAEKPSVDKLEILIA